MSTKSAILVLLFTSVFTMVHAQAAGLAGTLTEQSKLNAVIAVVAVILAGLFLFLFYLERKIKKMEDEVNK
jgi:cytochrome c biogenesis protein CcdA